MGEKIEALARLDNIIRLATDCRNLIHADKGAGLIRDEINNKRGDLVVEFHICNWAILQYMASIPK